MHDQNDGVPTVINGSRLKLRSDPAIPLVDVLRRELHLTGTHIRCHG
jgi:aerobic-type carbon monoxide dehydrogenase small subunit (CoxS/CutS family)